MCRRKSLSIYNVLCSRATTSDTLSEQSSLCVSCNDGVAICCGIHVHNKLCSVLSLARLLQRKPAPSTRASRRSTTTPTTDMISTSGTIAYAGVDMADSPEVRFHARGGHELYMDKSSAEARGYRQACP